MMDNPTTCPTCGAPCRVTGETTMHYEPLANDDLARRIYDHLLWFQQHPSPIPFLWDAWLSRQPEIAALSPIASTKTESLDHIIDDAIDAFHLPIAKSKPT